MEKELLLIKKKIDVTENEIKVLQNKITTLNGELKSLNNEKKELELIIEEEKFPEWDTITLDQLPKLSNEQLYFLVRKHKRPWPLPIESGERPYFSLTEEQRRQQWRNELLYSLKSRSCNYCKMLDHVRDNCPKLFKYHPYRRTTPPRKNK